MHKGLSYSDTEQLHTYVTIQLHTTVGLKQTDLTILSSFLYPETGNWSVFPPLPRSTSVQAPIVQRKDNAIHRINRYPVDKC